ncbi:MAG: branched-chain amino acid ABC transporter permease, partial [Dehalococcoidia bacterium]|nr:branched-chain amino acid ABC transporter permease [Dehalococcoidia bacterium]
YVLVGALVLGLAAFPQLVSSPYLLSIFIFVGIFAIVAMGLCLLMGYAGQISMGQAAFYAVGAYTSGVLTATYKWDPWIAMVAAVLLTGLVAVATGTALLRFQGHVLAVATLALTSIVYIILVQMDKVTGGLSPGLPNVPHLSIAGFKLTTDGHYFYLTWAAVLVLLLLASNIVNSRVGRALRSFHHFYGGSEEAAQSAGVNPTRYKIQVFALSAMYASVAGSLYAHYISFLNPTPFNIFMSLQLLVMVILGGLRSLWGAILGALTVVALGEALREVVPKFMPGAYGEYQIVAYGLVMILILLVLPEGLVQAPRAIASGFGRLVSRRSGISEPGAHGQVAPQPDEGS